MKAGLGALRARREGLRCADRDPQEPPPVHRGTGGAALQEIAWRDWSHEAFAAALPDFRNLSVEGLVDTYRQAIRRPAVFTRRREVWTSFQCHKGFVSAL
ncbi:MAG: hypothetical protein COW55_13415 [Rhodobacteraceae bacterium CG17_big_fil_post_rev_8_21_14_2_50_65_11]|nr:MAG: hypothetical protein COW55_13415 [Rhodobacteraceae bacterium CG17_big_fil_post_rev_8_21_14_2_50_65_11]